MPPAAKKESRKKKTDKPGHKLKKITIKKRTHFKYSEEALTKALKAIREENQSVRATCRLYGVPRSTVQDRIKGRVPEQPRKVGQAPILGFEGEHKVVDWIIDLAKCGIPINKERLLDTVEKIINDIREANKLKKCKRPGQSWYQGFLRRHPEIAIRESEGINKARESVRQSTIKKWFAELEDFLDERRLKDMMNDPDRILNADETGISLCPKTGKVLAPKGYKNVYSVKKGNEKDTLTVLIAMTASGKICPPLVVFPYLKPPKQVADNMPKGWVLGKSESGWMRSDVFCEYISNDFNSWLAENNIKKPVILFVDGHKSHMSMQLSQFCEDNDIILYALPPNTTHIMQPADVSVFRPLKQEWKKTVQNWQSRSENLNQTVTKTNFCKIFKETLDKDMTQTIRNGFRKCGLFPFNEEAVDYSKCVKDFQERQRNRSSTSNELAERDFLSAQKVIVLIKDNLLEKGIDPDTVYNEIELAKSLFKEEKRRSTSKTPRKSTEVANPAITMSHIQNNTPDSKMLNAFAEDDVATDYSLTNDISIPDVGSLVSLNDISVIRFSDLNFGDPNEILTAEEIAEENKKDIPVEESSPCFENKLTHMSKSSIFVVSDVHNEQSPKNIQDNILNMQNTPKNNPIILNNDDISQIIPIEEIFHEPKAQQKDSTVIESESEVNFEPLSQNTQNIQVNTIDPFKNHLIFLNKSTSKTIKKTMTKFPSAISGEKWREYYESKENEKLNKVNEINRRKAEREKKKTEKAKTKDQRKLKRNLKNKKAIEKTKEINKETEISKKYIKETTKDEKNTNKDIVQDNNCETESNTPVGIDNDVEENGKEIKDKSQVIWIDAKLVGRDPLGHEIGQESKEETEGKTGARIREGLEDVSDNDEEFKIF